MAAGLWVTQHDIRHGSQTPCGHAVGHALHEPSRGFPGDVPVISVSEEISRLRHRVLMPPHAGGVSDHLGTTC